MFHILSEKAFQEFLAQELSTLMCILLHLSAV